MKYLILLLLLIPGVSALDLSPDEIRDIERNVEEASPTFTNILSTVYYTSYSRDFKEWYTGEAENYDTRAGVGWCIIPESKRGFYEDVMCQGSGVARDKLFSYLTIGRTLEDSTRVEGFERGRTATGTDATPKRTVAVNPISGTRCHIPYGTLMYIDWGSDNPWSGVYRAEDTGAAFRGECKIDVYVGVGEDSVNEAIGDGISNAHPRIYLLDDDHDVISDPSFFTGTSGVLYSDYSYTSRIRDLRLFYNEVFRFVDDLESCGIHNPACVDGFLEQERTVSISKECPFSDYKTGNLSSHSDFSLVTGELIRFIEGSNGERAFFNNSYYDELFIVDFERDRELFYDKGSPLEFLNVSSVERVTEGGTLNGDSTADITPNEYYEFQAGEYNQASYRTEYLLGEIARQIKDCSTSNGECSCNITFPGFMERVEFNNSIISFNNINVDTNTSIKLNNITNITNFPFEISEDREEELFVKNNTVYMRQANIDARTCTPTERYYLFCAENDKEFNNEDIYKNKLSLQERAERFRINFAYILN